MEKIKAIINNKEIDNGQWLEIISPTSLKPIGEVSALSPKEIDSAFTAARGAQVQWEATSLLERIGILDRFKEAIIKNKSKIVHLMMSEIAKSESDSATEVDRTVEYINFTFEEAKRLYPWASSGEEFGAKNKLGIFRRVAKGVGLAISPFNYPVNLSISKIIPALVTGNTVVFKPATQGSLTGAFLGRLGLEAKLPAGIFNIVTGRGREIGDYITQNKEIDFISFTGSTSVGERIKAISSSKDLVLELGGKDPALVLDDHNLEKYASEIVSGAFGYSGQRCTAIKRVFTTNAIADQLIPLLKAKIVQLSVGAPEDNSDIIPVIDEKSAEFIQGLIDEAIAKKAKVIFGNNRDKNLMDPTLIDYVTLDMKLAWEEPFGPVLPVIRLDSVDEMISAANESQFGLQASIFTSDINDAMNIAHKLKTGTVNINAKSTRGPDSFPFLGINSSGMGVQGIHETLKSVTRYQGLVINWN